MRARAWAFDARARAIHREQIAGEIPCLEMRKIMMRKWKVPVTASWSAKLPDELARIGISRGPPRGQRGYRMYRPLMPGAWFRTVPPEEFHKLYMAQLAELDPERLLIELNTLAAGKTPALLCFEPPPPDPRWCHRGWSLVG